MMSKNAITFLITLLITITSFAQHGINYKALIKDDLGNVVASQAIGVQFQIREATVNGSAIYTETHTSTTDSNGILVLNIGTGNTVDNFNAINWAIDEHFINVQVNVNGAGLTDLGTTQFMTVPYAIHAATAGNASSRIDDLSDGKSDTNGSSLFIGIEAGLNDDRTSNRNVGLGYRSLYLNTNGNNNTANGYQALRDNTTGTNNSAFGAYSLYNNTTGRYNSANGASGLFSNTTGDYNTANGYRSLYSNTEGDNNTAIGDQSLNSNTTGSDNTASGSSALENNTTGTNNTANGYYSMRFNTTGNNNTSIGKNSLVLNTIGNDNTAIGYNALSSYTIGNRNVAIGKGAGANNLSGSNNIYIGFEAGSTASLSENNKLYINNEKSITPLIYGEFDNETITLNGSTTVHGDTVLDGELNTTSTGNANMVPIAYGTIASNGDISAGSGNFTVTKIGTGGYDITINNEVWNSTNYITMLSRITNTSGYIKAHANTSGFFRVTASDYDDAYQDTAFSFVIYKP